MSDSPFPPLISLASGYGAFPMPAVAAAAATAAIRDQSPLPVGPVAGQPALREALAARYQRQGAAVTPEQIVVTPGGKAALFALLKTILQPGDEVILPTPAWFGFWELIARAGGVARPLLLSPADDYALPPARLTAALTPRTRLLLLTNPHNPTGRTYGRAEMTALLAVTRRRPDVWVLADEIYDLINFGPAPVPTLLSFDDPHRRHLVVNGFSKSLALIGWGLGYLVAPPAVAQACAAWQFATGSAVPAPAQAAARAATDASAAIAADLRAQLAATREIMFQELAGLPDVPPSAPPAGTYYAFPDLRAHLPPADRPEAAAAALVQRLHAAGVEVVDGAGCGAPGFVRLSYAVPPALLTEALRRLRTELARTSGSR